MIKNIEILCKHNYGQTVYYPSCITAVLLARLAGTKTLTKNALEVVKELGYEIVVHHENAEV